MITSTLETAPTPQYVTTLTNPDVGVVGVVIGNVVGDLVVLTLLAPIEGKLEAVTTRSGITFHDAVCNLLYLLEAARADLRPGWQSWCTAVLIDALGQHIACGMAHHRLQGSGNDKFGLTRADSDYQDELAELERKDRLAELQARWLQLVQVVDDHHVLRDDPTATRDEYWVSLFAIERVSLELVAVAEEQLQLVSRKG